MPANVHAFVLLGAFVIHCPWQLKLNVVTKDKNLFCCPIELRQVGTKAEQRTER